jgi:presenilin-like A22 family membrane protease
MAEGSGAGVLSAMKDQWTSMTGMAFMFVSTILIGLSIQPIYNIPEARAFGEEGASKGAFVALELALIGVFTIVIIWLARRGLEFFIKAIVLFALWMSLFYALQPYVALILYFMGLDTLTTVLVFSLFLSIGSIYLLHRYPEWYVVNGVGILVGAGVITLIGVSFVPVLIIGFMIAAAIYDYWAVNGSKHMLELADTMIGLKLPVLLVAPKSANYSFLDEKDSVMSDNRDIDIVMKKEDMDWENPVPMTNEGGDGKKGRDALFMGLGDVIFPGMLVISSVSFLPQTGGEVTYFSAFGVMYADSLIVAMGTLLGGLLGYFGLMPQVAMGRPQAGLPMLNGGSILGYLISGYFALGLDNLWQDNSFF